MQLRRRYRTHALPLALLSLLPAIWWYPLLLGQLPNFMDTITHGYPLRMAVARQIRDATLPLWMPNIFSGTPLAANPQLATWYPPHLLFYLMPGPLVYGVLCILHYIWGGSGAYFFVRRITDSLPAAVFAAVTFQFSAMLVSRIALLPHVYTIVWVPWILLAVERAVHERGFLPARGALLCALLLALQLLAGSPQISYYTVILLPPYWLLRGISATGCRGSLLPRRVAELLSQGALAAVVAVLLSGIQILPTLEFLQNSERSTFSLERLRGQALNDGFIWRSFLGFTGNPIEDTDSINAVGVGALLLALVALLAARFRQIAVALWVVGVLGFFLALGPLVPVWSSVLPMYSSFHAPRRAMMFWTVAASLSSGLGAAAVHHYFRTRRWPSSGLYVLLTVLTAGTWWMLPRLEREFVPAAHLDAPPRYLQTIQEQRFLVLDPTFAYTYDSRRADYGRALLPNLAALHGLHDVNGYDPLVPERYGMARRLSCATTGILFPSHGVFLTNPNSPLLDLLAVEFLVGRYDLFNPGRLIPGTYMDSEQLSATLELVHADERWPLYRFRESRLLAWIPERVLSTRGAEEALQLTLQSDRPRQFAFVEQRLETEFGNTTSTLSVTSEDFRTVSVRLVEPLSAPAFVCVSIPWAPGWAARRGSGERIEVLPANGLIIGVLLPSGVEQFTLRYEPVSFVRGALATAAGVLLMLLFAFRLQRRQGLPA